jgi:anti-sigma B factor antagonist
LSGFVTVPTVFREVPSTLSPPLDGEVLPSDQRQCQEARARWRLVFPGFRVKIGYASRVGFLSFSAKIRHAEDVSFLEINGQLTSFESAAFREAVNNLLHQGHKNIVLNLTGLEYLDSSGIGELVRNYMTVVKKSGAMRVVGLRPRVQEILRVTQLYQVFPEFPDEASARQSFSPRNGKAIS